MLFDARVNLREGADRAGDRAGGYLRARADQPLLGADEFGISLRELQTKGGGFGMHAMRTANGRRELVFEGPAL